MGTISNLMDRLSRSSKPDRSSINVTAFGFTVGETFVAWQAVAAIQAYKVELPTGDEAVLEFTCNGHGVHVSEEQPGFGQLEQAMIAVFPATAHWRHKVLLTAFEERRTPLFRRD